MMLTLLKRLLQWLSAFFQTKPISAAKPPAGQSPTPPASRPAMKQYNYTTPPPPQPPPSAGNQAYFAWPSTHAAEGNGQLSSDHFLTKQGLLSTLGYQVGTNGLPPDHRRAILDAAFQQPLPALSNAAYLAEWGAPKSAQRLQKLAESIAAFARNAKRRNSANLHKSIRDWEADLAYLKRRYYDGRFSFPWPATTLKQP